MPPKSSSPVKPRTLSTFFTKDAAAATNNSTTDVNSAKPIDATDSAANPTSPEKRKTKKRATKSNAKEASENQQPASADNITTTQGDPLPKGSPKPKGNKRPAAKKESFFEVAISVGESDDAKDATSTDTNNPNPTTTTDSNPSPFLAETKEGAATAPRSPNKFMTVNGTVILNGTAGTSSSNLSKFNKSDAASMFKVRSGKAYITETKLRFSAHPSAIADLCRFHEYREELREAEDLTQYPGAVLMTDHVEITSLPAEHYSLIAKLVEESELLLAEMATGFMTTLCPSGFEAFEDFAASIETQDADEKMEIDGDVDVDVDGGEIKQTPVQRIGTTVSPAAVMEAVQAVAQRVNYGIPVSNLPGPVPVTPPNLSVYRWEVQDIDRYFPSNMKAAVLKRRSKRMEASAALTAWYLGLDAKQQEELCPAPVTPVKAPGTALGVENGPLAAGKRSRLSIGGESMDVDTDGASLSGVVADRDGVSKSGAILVEGQPTVAAALDPAIIESKLKEAEAKKKEAEAKEERRLEKERKMAERQIEKDMKEAERVQKEEAKKRKAEEERLKKEQTSMRFVGFFKAVVPLSTKKDVSQTCTKNDPAAPSLSELFHPFHVKKYTTLAPINQFTKEVTNEAIDKELNINPEEGTSMEVSSDMDVDCDHEVPPTIEEAAAQAILSGLFSKSARPNDTASQHRKKKLPRCYKSMTVPEVVQSGLLLQDEDDDTNYVLTWKDIPSLRMRLMQFAENYRPAYYGTWSKRSKNVSGRRFLGKDTELIDYDFDSEAEWEEDEEGEECKSDDDEEDAEDLGSDQDEEDDWLVPEGYLSEDEGLDAGEEGGSKSEMNFQKKSKELRRPAVAQMTPIIVGPVFEMTLGECSSHPALEPYHVEFLGDYGIGMDMFHAVETSAPPPSCSQV
ncbi:hypothetical protein EDD21DRAFT_385294 [Dissophora ornata]|nr:hypothetical protein EDD21DRAFT_385294 [Dissophora ornata]